MIKEVQIFKWNYDNQQFEKTEIVDVSAHDFVQIYAVETENENPDGSIAVNDPICSMSIVTSTLMIFTTPPKENVDLSEKPVDIKQTGK